MTRSRLPFALALAAAPLAGQSGASPAPAPRTPPAAAAASAAPAQAPQAPPDTEIFVADLVREGGAWRVERPRNVTRRVGYDNQPWFLPDGQRLLYTSQRGESSDIFELDLATGRERQVTATPESEFSPQLAADGRSVVVVRVEADTTQRLWRFPLAASGAPVVVAPVVKGVGYHAWADTDTVAVFVLGQPFTLQIVELDASGNGSAKIVASAVGRSIHRVPDSGRGTHEVSYTAPEGDRRAIFAHDPATGENRKLAPAPPTEEGDYAWTPDGALLAAVGSKLFRAVPGAEAAWTEIADLTEHGIARISRLAVSPIGDKLALVVTR